MYAHRIIAPANREETHIFQPWLNRATLGSLGQTESSTDILSTITAGNLQINSTLLYAGLGLLALGLLLYFGRSAGHSFSAKRKSKRRAKAKRVSRIKSLEAQLAEAKAG